jgi:ketosteroid isomerase-like protein
MIIKNVSLTCLMALLFACNDKAEKKEDTPPQAVDKEQVKREIQAKEDQFAEVYNGGVVKEIGYYAEDATSFFQNREPLVGRPAIIEFLKADVGSNKNKISFQTNEVFVSNDGNMVLEIGAFKVVDSVSTILNKGNYMSFFEKRNGKYVSVRDMSASDMPFK